MGDWTDRLVEVNRPAGKSKLVIAHLHPGEVSTVFEESLVNTLNFDLATDQRLYRSGQMGLLSVQAGAGSIARARNQAVAGFLDGHPDADLLLFVDSDMGWDPQTVSRLADQMDANGWPILGGLCFTHSLVGRFEGHAPAEEMHPTLYLWDEDGKGYEPQFHYPPDAVVTVGATGGAFLMISRRCLEELRAAEGDDWFSPVMVEGNPRPFGEDMSFCTRARAHGFPTRVDTGAKIVHHKSQWITEDEYVHSRRPASSAVTVVIPMKDRLELTKRLLGDLRGQGGYSEILIMDNGSTEPETRAWLESQQIADVFDATGLGIHEMWNFGLDEAFRRHGGLADVVLLNNDLRAGPRFLRRLVGGMRSTDASVVSGNYDGRPGVGVQPVRGICAGRYDGSGGLAGFAFAVRAEWAGRYRFPTECAWYFGDNDLCASVEEAGGWYGVVLDALVEHVDGGSNTFGSPVGPSFEADREAFFVRWPQLRPAA